MKPSVKATSPPLVDTCFVPLCIDLDGTLVRTDTLVEAVLALVRERPLYLFPLPVWLIRGRACLKQQVVKHLKAEAKKQALLRMGFEKVPIRQHLSDSFSR